MTKLNTRDPISINWEAQQDEYQKQLKAGLNPQPLVPRISLEELAGTKLFDSTRALERTNKTVETNLRGIPIRFQATSRRILWQSFGQEYIEADLLDFIDEIPKGGIFYDVGASIGLFSIYAAMRGVQTFCFEPEIANFNLLNTNSFLNWQDGLLNIQNFNVALSNENGIGNLYIRKFEEAAHEKIMGRPLARTGSEEFKSEYIQKVIKYKLDDFLSFAKIPNPEYLKIDVDGAEHEVLEGAQTTLKNSILKKIFIEINEKDEDSLDLLKHLSALGFESESKKRVQNYFGEYNYILKRR